MRPRTMCFASAASGARSTAMLSLEGGGGAPDAGVVREGREATGD